MKKALWLILFISNFIYSQTIIKGKISDESNKAISNVSVLIYQKSTDNVITYTISDGKGFYSISFSSSYQQVDIQVRCMGYKTITETIDNKTQSKNFLLNEKAYEIKEVIIKTSPIRKVGDTINYSVSSFSKEQDRSIGDVLKRMPGIEVLSDGKILYQGKPINKYYIEGLDLLEGKYNLANENLPHKEVTQVQILENHQPIKVLDGLQFSDKAALNIKLKNKYAFTGQARLGSGFSPLLWDANLTPMLFAQKRQTLASYQTNNTGDNIAAQLKTLTIEDLLDGFENHLEKYDWLGIQQLSVPSFSEKRWLDNNIHILTANHLHKLKKDYEYRLNVSYQNDYQQQKGFANTLFFTPKDIISILENKYDQLYFNSLETNLTLQKNASKKYLKNSAQFQGFWDSQKGNIQQFNREFLTQNLSNRYFKLSNKFKTIFPIGKRLLTLNSYVGINKTPQTLKIRPGQFKELLNENNPYETVVQNIDLHAFYTDNSISFTKVLQRLSFFPKLGFKLEKQNLQSQITTSANQNLSNQFSNNLDWIWLKVYFDLQTQYKKNKWQIELISPINFHSYQIKDLPLQKSQRQNRLTFEPRLAIVYDANAFWKINASARVSNIFGVINQLHYAYILQTYRNLQLINTPLPHTFNKTLTGEISYRNPIKYLFWKIIYTRAQSINNQFYETQIFKNGAAKQQAIGQENAKTSHNILTFSSKYFNKIKTNATFKTNYERQSFQQILNAEITDIKNENWGFGGKIETDFTDWFQTEYQYDWRFSKNQIQSRPNSAVNQQNHLLNVNFYPTANHYFSIKTEFVKNNLFTENTENVFSDFIYRYAWKKKNIDFELQWSNIFNTANYRTVNMNIFSYVETNFWLRPRQILFKARVSLK